MRSLATLTVCLLMAGAAAVHAAPWPPGHVDDVQGKSRVLVLTDIANEPDDQMSLVRFLVYSNEFDIEGLVATTSTWQKRDGPAGCDPRR